MSYVRGEVYVIGTGDEEGSWWECLSCKLCPTKFVINGKLVDGCESLYFETQEELLEHLREHKALGHDTGYAIERCEAELRGEEYEYPIDPELEAAWAAEELLETLATPHIDWGVINILGRCSQDPALRNAIHQIALECLWDREHQGLIS